jgi:hypothetical protein
MQPAEPGCLLEHITKPFAVEVPAEGSGSLLDWSSSSLPVDAKELDLICKLAEMRGELVEYVLCNDDSIH